MLFRSGLQYDVSTTAAATAGDPTNDNAASASASLVSSCQASLRRVFGSSRALSNEVDPELLRSRFQICSDDPTTDAELGDRAAAWLNTALAYMAMGNFPYPSGYILNGDGVFVLPENL